MQKLESGNYRSLTFDEISMERSKSFVKALQELKNLRPQLYSAAEYCEKSYLNSDQKQMVLDNLKDYTVRAVVNAIDHLGTVAYKLTKLFEQQSLDVSSVEIRIAGLNEKMLVCQTYTDKEGLKQHQLFVNKPRHHKHYVLPNSVSKKVRFSPLRQMDIKQNPSHDKLRPYLSDNPASRTLSWHLSTENKSSIPNSSEDAGPSNQSLRINSTFSHLTVLDDKKGASSMSPMANPWGGGNGLPLPSVFLDSIGFSRRDSPGVMKPMSSSSYKPSDTPRWDISSTSSRNKNVFTMFFAKQKSSKQKMVNAS